MKAVNLSTVENKLILSDEQIQQKVFIEIFEPLSQKELDNYKKLKGVDLHFEIAKKLFNKIYKMVNIYVSCPNRAIGIVGRVCFDIESTINPEARPTPEELSNLALSNVFL